MGKKPTIAEPAPRKVTAQQLEAEIERLMDQLETIATDDRARQDLQQQLDAAMRAELHRMDEAFESTFLIEAATVERQRREAQEFLQDS